MIEMTAEDDPQAAGGKECGGETWDTMQDSSSKTETRLALCLLELSF